MLRSAVLVARETALLLRRDRIFWPALALALASAALAVAAGGWAISEYTKVLYDVALFGFQLTGGLVAVVWGTKTLADSRQEGFLEVQLAAPIGRTAWLLGKYCGLAACMLLLAVLITGLWQGLLFAFGLGVVGRAQLAVFAMMTLGWLVVAALAVLMATLARSGVALIGTVALWVAGLASSLVAATLGAETPPALAAAVRALARFWDLQQFNLADRALEAGPLALRELAWRGSYGILLIAALLSGAAAVWERRDII